VKRVESKHIFASGSNEIPNIFEEELQSEEIELRKQQMFRIIRGKTTERDNRRSVEAKTGYILEEEMGKRTKRSSTRSKPLPKRLVIINKTNCQNGRNTEINRHQQRTKTCRIT
jgi:hypothetical protein